MPAILCPVGIGGYWMGLHLWAVSAYLAVLPQRIAVFTLLPAAALAKAGYFSSQTFFPIYETEKTILADRQLAEFP